MSILRIVWYVALIIFVGSVTIISLIFGGWIALGGFMIGIGLIMAAIVLSIYELIKSNLTH